MDYEKSDLDHSEMPFFCPACDRPSSALVCELERNPQVLCPYCDCIHLVNIEERKDRLDEFWQKVKNFKNGMS